MNDLKVTAPVDLTPSAPRGVLRDDIARRIAEYLEQPWDDASTDQDAARDVADQVMPVVDMLRTTIVDLWSQLNAVQHYACRCKSETCDLVYRVTLDGAVTCWSSRYGWHRSCFRNLNNCDEYDRAHFADHLDRITVDALPVGAR
jgi:hypothetical protein